MEKILFQSDTPLNKCRTAWGGPPTVHHVMRDDLMYHPLHFQPPLFYDQGDYAREASDHLINFSKKTRQNVTRSVDIFPSNFLPFCKPHFSPPRHTWHAKKMRRAFSQQFLLTQKKNKTLPFLDRYSVKRNENKEKKRESFFVDRSN